MRPPSERLTGGIRDLVVIGGGINGAGVARDAALRDMDVVLLEKGDYARGTSSASTKLVHGGLRYLEQFEFGLVFEALRERKTLLEIASHLVHPLQFLFPVYEQSRVSPWKLKAGLVLYDLLSLTRSVGTHRFLDPEEIRDVFPELGLANLETAALYYDCQMDDARIVLENVIDAAEAGARAANYCEVTDVEPGFDSSHATVHVRDHLRDEDFELRARTIVNATGPWSDRLSRRWRHQNGGRLRPTKGVHLVLPRLKTEVAGFFPSIHDDRRLFFAIPWRERTLLGTTDTEFEGDPEDLAVEPRDREYLLSNLNHYLDERSFETADILAEFAGLRPLYDAGGGSSAESDVSRDHEIINTRNRIYSIVGGKYTTYRAVAEETLAHLDAPGRCVTDERPLPGGWTDSEQRDRFERALAEEYELDPAQLEELLNRYGRRAPEVLDTASTFEDALRPVGEHPTPLRAQVYHAVLNEWARKPRDVIRRRTDLFLRPDPPVAEVRKLVAKALDHLGLPPRVTPQPG